MKKFAYLLMLMSVMFAVKTAQAYDGVTSEVSHAAGGAALAGAITAIYKDSENRAWIGFGVSSAVSIFSEVRQYNLRGNIKVSSSLLDATSHVLGSALGAWATDKYLLVPVVTKSYTGVVIQRQF